MTDPAALLDFLHRQRDAAPDAATRAMFDALIAEKEAQQATASRDIRTGGGDYAERDVDKRSGTFVEGNQYNWRIA